MMNYYEGAVVSRSVFGPLPVVSSRGTVPQQRTSRNPVPPPVPSSVPRPASVLSSVPIPQPVPSSNPIPQPVPSSNPIPQPVPSVNEGQMRHEMRVHNPDEDAMSDTDLDGEKHQDNDNFLESLDNVIHDLQNEASEMKVDSPRNKRKEDERDEDHHMDEGFLNIKGFRKLVKKDG